MNWISYIKTEENKALRQIYVDYRQNCCSWLIQKFNLTEEDAKEVFQASVVILYDNVRTGKLVQLNSNIKTYLFGIAKNQAYNFLNKRKKENAIDAAQLIQSHIIQEKNIEEKTEIEIKLISKQLTVMGNPCKTLLSLYYYEERKMDEITVLMGYNNRNTTKAKKYQCLKRLQSMVQSNYSRNFA